MREALTSLNVSRETEAQLHDFVAMVKKWNPVINLIARSSVPNIWSRHIEDSAQIVALANASGPWIDIGSGGGFPGIVAAICLKEIAPSPALPWSKATSERPPFSAKPLSRSSSIAKFTVLELNL